MATNSIVALEKCACYGESQVYESIKQALDHIGGISSFIDEGDRVFLKANLLYPTTPSEAITTHPMVVRSLVRMCEEVGASVMVGDSPGGPMTKARLEKNYRRCGMYDAIKGTNAELNWNCEKKQVSLPHGVSLKQVDVIEAVTLADKVISLPKLKTHTFTTYTGATKNMFGILPGMLKARFHARFPLVQSFSKMLVDVLGAVEPDLVVMDAVWGMEGNGPSAGDPIEVGAILASSSSLALDVIACKVAGINPQNIGVIHEGRARGLIPPSDSQIVVRGVEVEEFSHIHFKLAGGNSVRIMIPSFLRNNVGGWFSKKPVVDGSRCIGCGECVQSCPKNCIRLDGGVASIEYRDCIKCYCCHEICPKHAIGLK